MPLNMTLRAMGDIVLTNWIPDFTQTKVVKVNSILTVLWFFY